MTDPDRSGDTDANADAVPPLRYRDEVGLNIHPVLLGAGIPLFHGMSRQIDLELLDCRVLETGCVYVLYRVKR
jgi:dihydrofolate reductase